MTKPRRTGSRIELGKWGERQAGQFLKKKGYRIIERGYRSALGEIDIIAKDGGTISFIEVKTRRSEDYGSPQEAVTKGKQHHLRKAASLYLKRNGWEAECRFDVVSILVNSEKKVTKIELIKDAFRIEGG